MRGLIKVWGRILRIVEVLEQISVGAKQLGLGYESNIMTRLIEHGKVPCAALFKLPHHHIHIILLTDKVMRIVHQIVYKRGLIKVLIENNMAYFIQINDAN